jgi:hypothetical protein
MLCAFAFALGSARALIGLCSLLLRSYTYTRIHAAARFAFVFVSLSYCVPQCRGAARDGKVATARPWWLVRGEIIGLSISNLNSAQLVTLPYS